MEDQIRQSRLNRFAQFGSAPAGSSASSGASTPQAAGGDTPAATAPAAAAQAPAPPAGPPAASAPNEPAPPPVPATSTGESGAQVVDTGAGPAPPAETVAEPAAEPAPAAAASTPVPQQLPQKKQQDPAEWAHATITSVLRVSLEPKQGNIYLESLADEKQAEAAAGGRALLAADDLDSVMWGALLSPDAARLNGGADIFDYLFSSWERSVRAARSSQAVPGGRELVESIQRSLVQYAVICGTSSPDEDMHGDLGGRLLVRVGSGVPWDFVGEVMANAAEQELLEDLLGLVFGVLLGTLRRNGMSTDNVNVCSVALNLLNIKVVALAVPNLPGFAIQDGATPRDVVQSTFLGTFFNITPLDNDYPTKLFPGIHNMSPSQVNQIINGTMGETLLIMDRLHMLCDKLVRSSAQNREHVLDFFAKVLDMNHKRSATQVDKKLVSGDGFMANITYVVVKFCEPFIDFKGNKLDKINPLYYKTPGAYDIEEETKLVSDVAESKEWLHTDRETVRPNFITEIFFLAIGFLEYGLAAIIQSDSRLRRHRDQISQQIENIQPMLRQMRSSSTDAPRADFIMNRINAQLGSVRAEAASLQIVLRHEEIMTRFYDFATFVFMYVVNRAEPSHTYPRTSMDITSVADSQPEMVYKAFPEYMVRAPVHTLTFIGQTMPQVPRQHLHQEIVESVIFFLRAPQYIRNPYLKSEMAEVLYFGSVDIPFVGGGSMPGYYTEIFNTSQVAMRHLFHALMKLYIDIEQTGRSSQFYDKFRTREIVASLMKVLWLNPVYRQNLEAESHENLDFFVKFVALLLNDSTYLLDEALHALQEIHRLQEEAAAAGPAGLGSASALQQAVTENGTSGAGAVEGRDSPNGDRNRGRGDGNEEDENATDPARRLAQLESEARFYLKLSTSTVGLLNTFTSSVPKPFVAPEIVDQFASMLNYNLTALVGPKMRELKVQSPEKYGFNPRALLVDLVRVYLNLASFDEFVRAVARDGRSYSVSNFESAESILSKRSLLPEEQLTAWRTLKDKTTAVQKDDELDEEEMADAPEEFLDPLMFHIMENPVILPTSKVTIDLSTIKSHLLSDPIDPFNRQPLKLEDVVPNAELKRQIEEFRHAKRAAKAGQAAESAVEPVTSDS